MILKQTQNTPVAAPQFNDMTAALVVYREFMNNQTLTMSEFATFMSMTSVERNAFLELFTTTASIVENTYVQITYN